MKEKTKIKPFKNFKALDGYHCQTNSFAKIFHFYNFPLSEEMLLGIGSGLGFIYWHQKGTIPFMGGRDNNKNFHRDIGERTGVAIEKRSTSSTAKAEKSLIEMLNNQEPVMMFVDMGFLPCFDFGEDYHFGGHTHVVGGFNGRDRVLVSEMDPEGTELKKGFFYEMSLEQLARARGSKFKPFPPDNAYFVFDFTKFRSPTKEDLFTAIAQTVKTVLSPPISNLGIKGIRKAGTMIMKWEKQFPDNDFRMSLFNIYLFVTVAGTGGGLFRYMYGRFLKEVSGIVSEREFDRIGDDIIQCGRLWTDIALPMKDALDMENPGSLVKDIQEKFNVIADKEEQVFQRLREILN